MKYIKFTKQYLSYEIDTALKGKDFDRLVNLLKVAEYINEDEYLKMQSEAKKKAFDLAEKLKEDAKQKAVKTPCAECGEKAKSLEAQIEERDKEIETLKAKIEELEKVEALVKETPKAPKK